MPPVRNQGEVSDSETKIVSELGKEFNIDEVYGSESSFIGSLKSVDDFQPVEVQPNCPLTFDQQMLEVCDFLFRNWYFVFLVVHHFRLLCLPIQLSTINIFFFLEKIH